MSDAVANIRTMQLQDLCDFVRGVTFEQYEASPSPAEGLVPILRAGNIGSELSLDRDLVYVPENRVSHEQLLQQGDSVICMSSGSALVVGKTAYLGHPWVGSVGAFCGIVRPRRATVEPRWLSLWMHSDTFVGWRDSQARGANIQNLRFSELGSIPVQVPTLSEQKRIAAKLDEQMATLASAQAALVAQREAATALRAAVLRAALDPATHPAWPAVQLSQICTIVMGQSPPGDTYATSPIGLPFFQGKVDFGAFSPTTRVWCASPIKIAEKGDILLCVRAPVGPTNVANERCCIGRGLAALRPSTKLLPAFLLWWLKYVEPQISSQGDGSTFSAIGKADLQKLSIQLPALSEQRRIAERLDNAMKEMDAVVASLDNQALALDSLRTSLLDAAFSGQV